MFALIVVACRNADTGDISENRDQSESNFKASSPRSSNSAARPQIWPILEGLQLILSSSYLLQVALFLWLSAVVSSFFYFQVRKQCLWTFIYLFWLGHWEVSIFCIVKYIWISCTLLYLTQLTKITGASFSDFMWYGQ